MKDVELLAPVGSFESLKAAVQNGANAVYLGGKEFSARASANNFDKDELKEAVKYAHIRGVRVFVTTNTLIKQNELDIVWTVLGEKQKITGGFGRDFPGRAEFSYTYYLNEKKEVSRNHEVYNIMKPGRY